MAIGLLQKIADFIVKRSSFARPDSWLFDAFGARPTATGVLVSETSAMRMTAVYACVRILAETVASLPLVVYRRQERGKVRDPSHPLYRVLHDQANDEMTAMQLREALMVHVLLWGNAYAYIERDGRGQVAALWPLLPDRTYPLRDSDGNLQYLTTLSSGEQRKLPPQDVLHVPGLGFDGLVGQSPIRMAMEAVGLGLAAEAFGAKFFGNGAHLSMVFEHPHKLSPEAYERLKKSLENAHTGLDKAHKIKILEEGMKVSQLTVPPDQAQFLETRKFQVNEICRIFRVPPHLVGDLDRATFSNIEHQSIEFVVHTIRPWLVRWEQAINNKLFTASERAVYFAEHIVDGLLRGDIKSRYDAYSIAINNGWMSPDEVRELENLNPMPNGQGSIYRVPVNTMPADLAREFWQQKVKDGGDNIA